jgi:uncharacterized protein YcbX
VHLTFQPSLLALGTAIGLPRLPAGRFRPNLHLEWDAAAFVEDDLTGAVIAFEGGTVLRLRHPCERGMIPTHRAGDPEDLDRELLKWLTRERDMNFGVIADVVIPGRIRYGEHFTVLSPAGSEA